MINKSIFIDGPITDYPMDDDFIQNGFDMCIIDAAYGYTESMQKLEWILEKEAGFDDKCNLITNSLDVWANMALRKHLDYDYSKFYVYRKSDGLNNLITLYGTWLRDINCIDKMYKAGLFNMECSKNDKTN